MPRVEPLRAWIAAEVAKCASYEDRFSSASISAKQNSPAFVAVLARRKALTEVLAILDGDVPA